MGRWERAKESEMKTRGKPGVHVLRAGVSVPSHMEDTEGQAGTGAGNHFSGKTNEAQRG